MDPLGSLTVVPALERLDLVGDTVAAALRTWDGAAGVGVVEIDPEFADTEAMCAAYDLPLESSVNCVVVTGKRAGEERTVACLVRADTRADVNGLVRKSLDVRKCSFLDHERAVAETAMVYGGITPVGLPEHWRLFVDAAAVEVDRAIVGSGVRGSKLVLPGPLLAELPDAEVIDGLGQ